MKKIYKWIAVMLRRRPSIQNPFKLQLNFKTWLFFVTSLFIIGIGVYLLQQTKSAKAAWFDESYSYRQRVSITNGGSAQTDLQVGITMNTSTLITANKMQADCDDIRIVTENGQLLPHWIQEQTADCNATNTRIWVKLSSVPTTEMNIYIYYGNAAATNIEDPEEVFLFFEDFNNALNTGKWGTKTHASGTGASYNIASGTINFTTTTGGGYYWLYSTEPIAQPYWIETNVRNNYATSGNVVRVGSVKAMNVATNGNLYPGYAMDDAGNSTLRIVGDTTAGGFLVTTTANATTSGIWRFGWLATSSQQAFLNDTSVMTGTNNTSPIANSYIYLGTPTNATTGTVTYDWVFARKYVATMPTIGTFGSEEATPGPIAYWKFDEQADNTCPDGSDACDSTDNKWNMSVTGNVTRKSPDMCVSGSCLYFDGNGDYLSNANSPDLTTQFTMSAWVKSPNFTTGMYVIEVEYGEPLLHVLNHDIMITMRDAGNTTWNSYASGDALVDNEWNHIAVTYDSSDNVKFYHNGRLISSTTHTGQIGGWASTSNTWIGGRAGVYFNGFIDEPKIYAYARSAEEIKADFIQGASANGSAAVFGKEDQSSLSNGLVGYWKMDESTWVGANAVLDSSGNLNSGTAVNGAGITIPGKFGNAGIFDGVNDYVDAGSSPSLSDLTKFTVSTWINPTGWGESSYGRIFDKTNKYFYLDNVTGTAALNFVQLGGTGTGQWRSADNSVSLSTWQHILLTYDSSSVNPDVKMYVNGKSVAVTEVITPTGPPTSEATSNLIIGNKTATDRTFNGRMDEVRIYNRALSPREVSQLYQWAPPPVAYWDMNEHTGTTLNDKSGNGYTGTITGAEWATGKYGGALRFNGADYVNIASPSFSGIAGHITLSMWVNGDAALQPQTNSVFEGYGVGSTRVLNAHLPWSNSNIYWDAGPGTGVYNRINKLATNADFEGDWNNWAFTKDISTGSMKIYLNGVLWHSGVGNTQPIGTMTTFRIGSYADGTNNYDGLIDDFRIYNYERTAKQIVQDMNAGHPSVGSPVGSPLGYWKFDEGYGTTANNNGNVGSTLNGTFGTGTSAPTWTNDGKFGKALSFDGISDYVNIPATINPGSEITLSAWVKTSASARSDIIAKLGAGSAGYVLNLLDSGGMKPGFWVGDTSLGYLIGTKNVADNQWHHIVGTYKDGTASIYIDGVFNINGARTVSLDATANTTIGNCGACSFLYPLPGQIDEVKIYNYALSADEVKVEYNQGKSAVLGSVSTGIGGTTPSNSALSEYCVPGDTSTCDAPVAEWLFNENVGTTAYDTSENSRNGSFGIGNSMPKWGVGIQGPAAAFDGTGDLIDTSSELSFSSATSYTVSGWLNPAIVSGTRYALDRTTGTNELISVGQENSSFFLQIRGDDGAGIVSYTAPSIFTAGKWTSFTIVRNVSTDTISTFINGQYRSQTTDTTTGTNSPIVRIGNHAGAAVANSWYGMIDQIRFYNYARTPAQIAWDYSKGAPVAHYKMDECEGTTIYNSAQTFNDAPAGNNGTLTIGASGTNTSVGTCSTTGAWFNGATGKRGASMDFDGTDDYIAITDSALFDVTKEVSYAVWIKPNGTKSGLILNKYVNGAEDKQLTLNVAGEILFYLYNWSGSSLTSTGTVTFGQWNHVVATYNGTTATIYINGKNAGSKTASSSDIADSTGDFYIGENAARGGVSGDGMGGSIDEVRIYNYSLTAEQVKTIYNNGAVSFE